MTFLCISAKFDPNISDCCSVAKIFTLRFACLEVKEIKLNIFGILAPTIASRVQRRVTNWWRIGLTNSLSIDTYASAIYRCPPVRRSQAGIPSKRLLKWFRGYLLVIRRCVNFRGIRASSKVGILPSVTLFRTLSRTLNLADLCDIFRRAWRRPSQVLWT